MLSASELDNIIAAVVDLRVRSRAAMLILATTVETEQPHLDHLLSIVNDLPLYDSTMLDAAEILARHGRADQAEGMLSQVSLQ